MFLFKSKKKDPKPKTIKEALERNVELEKQLQSMERYDITCQEQEIEWLKDHINNENKLLNDCADFLENIRKMIGPCERAIVLAEFIEKTTEELEKKKEESMSEEEYDAYLEKEIAKIREDMRAEEEEKKKKKKGIKTEPVVKPMERSPFGDLLDCRRNLERTMEYIDKMSGLIGETKENIEFHSVRLKKNEEILERSERSCVTDEDIKDRLKLVENEDEFVALKKDVEESVGKRK